MLAEMRAVEFSPGKPDGQPVAVQTNLSLTLGLRDGSEPESFLVEKLTGFSEDQVTELCSDMRQYTEDDAQDIARYIEDRVAEVVRAYEASH